MNNNNNELHFVLSSDENYVDKLAVTMISILEIHKENGVVNIHILSNNISDVSIEKIKTISTKFQNAHINIYNLNNLRELLGKEVNVDHLSLATYARLFISEFLSHQINIALYLDVDIIIRKNLSDVFSIDIANYYVAGVKSIIDLANSSENAQKIFHINAGVTLWNLKKCREENFVEKCIEYIKNTAGKIKFHDQTIINEVCKGNILAIHPQYNVMSGMFFLDYSKFIAVYGLKDYYSKEDYEDAVSSPSIIHLTSWVVGRPWEKGCVHPYKNEYYRVIASTPWKDKLLLENKKNKFNFIKLQMYRLLPGYLIRYATKIKRILKSKIGRKK